MLALDTLESDDIESFDELLVTEALSSSWSKVEDRDESCMPWVKPPS